MLTNSRLGLVLALLLAGSMWFYIQKVLIPYQVADAAAHGRPRGNLSDLYPRWLGARELLLRHRDPYSAEITREIQRGYYGRPLDPHLPGDPTDQQGFAYPVYVAFLLAPTIALPFPAVQEGFRWLLVALAVASVFLWMRALTWRPSIPVQAILVILTLGSFPAAQGIKLQQLSLLVGSLIAASAAAVAAGRFALSGFLLALATIKPQLALPLAGWLGLWTLGDWRLRQRFLWGFAITMAALLAASEYVLPGWMSEFHRAVVAYRVYTGGAGSLLDVLLTPLWGKAAGAAAVIGILWTGWRLRRASTDALAFTMMSALVLAVTLVIVPSFAPYNQILLLPAVFLLARFWNPLGRGNRLVRLTRNVSALVFFWPWLAAAGLAVCFPFVGGKVLQRAWAAPLYTSLAIPLVALGLLALCAINELAPHAQPETQLPKGGAVLH